jgi:hypothetical protein
MKYLAYPLFGVLVLGGYYYTVSHAIDPFAVSAERTAATGPTGSHLPRRPGGVFIYGGFAGGK